MVRRPRLRSPAHGPAAISSTARATRPRPTLPETAAMAQAAAAQLALRQAGRRFGKCELVRTTHAARPQQHARAGVGWAAGGQRGTADGEATCPDRCTHAQPGPCTLPACTRVVQGPRGNAQAAHSAAAAVAAPYCMHAAACFPLAGRGTSGAQLKHRFSRFTCKCRRKAKLREHMHSISRVGPGTHCAAAGTTESSRRKMQRAGCAPAAGANKCNWLQPTYSLS